MFLPEGFVGDEEAGDEAGFVEVGDGLGGAGEHESEGIQHGNGAEEEKEVEGADEEAGVKGFATDFGEDGHGGSGQKDGKQKRQIWRDKMAGQIGPSVFPAAVLRWIATANGKWAWNLEGHFCLPDLS